MQLGFAGLGRMGGGMAADLVRTGHPGHMGAQQDGRLRWSGQRLNLIFGSGGRERS